MKFFNTENMPNYNALFWFMNLFVIEHVHPFICRYFSMGGRSGVACMCT